MRFGHCTTYTYYKNNCNYVEVIYKQIIKIKIFNNYSLLFYFFVSFILLINLNLKQYGRN